MRNICTLSNCIKIYIVHNIVSTKKDFKLNNRGHIALAQGSVSLSGR